MKIKVVDALSIPSRRYLGAKFGPICAALDELPVGKALKIAPCPGKHKQNNCSLQGALYGRWCRGHLKARITTVHINGAIYISTRVEEPRP